jgi:hypothetical protein
LTNTHELHEMARGLFRAALSRKGIRAEIVDGVFDCEVSDNTEQHFVTGSAPFYVKIMTRGSETEKFNPQGHNPEEITLIRDAAAELHIPESAVYIVAAFFNHGDPSQMIFFGVPFQSLPIFKPAKQYRFSKERCEVAVGENTGVFKL